MPSREGSKKHKGDKGKYDGNDTVNMLAILICQARDRSGKVPTYSRYGNTMLFLNVVATQMRFNGSWSMVICSANCVALLLQRKLPPSGFMQMPKYPTRTSSIAFPTMFDIAVTTPGSTCEESNTGVYF